MIFAIQVAGSIIVIIWIIYLWTKLINSYEKIDKKSQNNEKLINYYENIEKENNKKSQNDEKLLDCYEKVYKTNYKTTNKTKKELGNEYELQIGRYFQSLNFKIYYNGINNGKKDGGIDIIGWNSEKVLLIQCKNHRSQINQDLLRKFIGDCKIYEEKNKYKIKEREIKRIFVSNSTADYGANKFLNENRNILEFLRIQAKCRC
ncbi:restriction endonuclease [Campylobacter sp.]|uniref:restriction endonuclease n=1 Tax=Campylobacter sp. TaxID=205 RepID=UPI002A7F61DD|nr:restriction endonuclease [Campylobacter sp.]MDY4155347.1 restriction endonuclease [Campylobacter sp.]MDY4445340.1 restriction endonuclease [Campylobacter sp.]